MRQVDLETSAGTIRVELDDEKAPETVKNFLTNVENGHYDGTVFHGPAFASLMDGARIGRNGSSGTLSVQRCAVPVGVLAFASMRARCETSTVVSSGAATLSVGRAAW